MMHVHSHDALTDPLPFLMQDTSCALACSGLAFCEPIQPTQTARPSWTSTGLIKKDGTR